METLLAIDPGRAKCGLAVVAGPDGLHCLERCVVETERLTLAVADLLRRHPTVTRFLLGNATHSAVLRRAIEEMFPQIPLETVNEYNTSARARARYVRDNPAPGWRRLLPPGMRSPEVPYDDYAALLLAEDYFSKKNGYIRPNRETNRFGDCLTVWEQPQHAVIPSRSPNDGETTRI